MHKAIRWIIRGCIILLSVDALIVLADSSGRLDWLEKVMTDHPALARVVRGPTFPLLCLGMVILVTQGEKYLRIPRIAVQFTNSKVIPNFKKVTLRQMFDADSVTRPPGWDKAEIDWLWFV